MVKPEKDSDIRLTGEPVAAQSPAEIEGLAESNRRLKRKIFDLYTIFELSKHLNSVLNTEALLDGIALTCIGQMGVNGAAIFVAAGSDCNDLVLARVKGLAVDHSRKMVIPEDSQLISLLRSTHHKPLSFKTIRDRLTDCKEVQMLESLECEYLITMSLKEKVRGLVSVSRKISGAEFFEDDLEFLSILANQLSVAIENARLFDSEKEAHLELRQTQARLVQTEKQAALGQLSARIAHEVNNPLGIIKNYLQIISDTEQGDQASKEYLQIVTEEVDRIARIVKQLLSLFRPCAEQFNEVDIESVLDETLLLISLQAQKRGIELEKEIAPDLPLVRGSSEQLKQVFLNLLINAFDFVPDGGKVKIAGYLDDGKLVLQFVDTGSGIPPENLDRVFEPFFTTKSDGKGTGLGLSVCYGIIESHKGEMIAGNSAGGGATFTITLPVSSEND